MMSMPTPTFQPKIAVRAGRVARELRIESQTAPKANNGYPAVRAEDAPSLVRALATLVAAGGWALPGELSTGEVVEVPSAQQGQATLVATLSACTPDAVRTLARMFDFLDVQGTRNVTSLSIVETADDDEARATAAALDERHHAAPGFRVKRRLKGDHEAKGLQVHIELDRPDDDPALEALRALFDAWGAVLALGGFPGPGIYPSSVGCVLGVEPGLAHEVIVEMEHLFGTEATWDPIYRGLARIHADVCPIREVRFS